MDTHSFAHALILFSLPFALAGVTTAACLFLKHQQRLEAAHVRQRLVTALRRQAAISASAYNRRKGLPAFAGERLQVIRLPRSEEHRPCLGVIAPEHVVCDRVSMPGQRSGPAEDN